MKVKRISWGELKNYWIEVNHFEDKAKEYTEIVKTLGHFECGFNTPRVEAYGLFKNDYMIGATQMIQWNKNWNRFRTVNIREKYRGNNLGVFMVDQAAFLFDIASKYLFAWVRVDYIDYFTKTGFEKISELVVDKYHHLRHQGMLKGENVAGEKKRIELMNRF